MVNKQDYMNAVNQNIEMVRGDTLLFNFILGGLNNYATYDSLEVNFSVAEHYDEPVIAQSTKGNGITLERYDQEKDEALFAVYLAPDKTKTMEIGRYYYDLQIKDSSNTVTLMRGYFTLVYDVAD